MYYCIFFIFCCISTSFAQMQDPIGIKTDDGNTVYGFQFNFTGSSGLETQSTPGGIPNVIFKLATSGPGAAWIQGGNAFGVTGVFGTLDNNDINVITNGRTVMNIFSLPADSVVHVDADTAAPGANALVRLNSGASGNSKIELYVNDTVSMGAIGYDPTLNAMTIDYGPTPNALFFRDLLGTVTGRLTSSGDFFLSGVGTSTLAPFKFYMNSIERMRIDTDGRVTKNAHGVAEMQSATNEVSQNILATCPSWWQVYSKSFTTTDPLTGVFMAHLRIENTSGSTRTYRMSIQRSFVGYCVPPIVGGSNTYWQSPNIANNQTITATLYAIEPSVSATTDYAICMCTIQTPPSGTISNRTLVLWEY